MNLNLKTSTVNQPGLFDMLLANAAGKQQSAKKNLLIKKSGKRPVAAKAKKRKVHSNVQTKASAKTPVKVQAKVQAKAPAKVPAKATAAPKSRQKVIDITAPPANTKAFRLWEIVKNFGKLVQKAIVFGEGDEGLIGDEATVLAWQGIQRHLKACERAKVKPDCWAIEEIIKDARHGRAQWCNIS